MELEEREVYDVIKKFDGMVVKRVEKILCECLLLLNIVNSPIDSNRIKEVWFPELKRKEQLAMKSIMAKGQNYSRIGYSETLSIFVNTSVWYHHLLPSKCMYYHLAYDPPSILKKLNKENLFQDFRATKFEQRLMTFLKTNKPNKRNSRTGDFELLKVFKPITVSELFETKK